MKKLISLFVMAIFIVSLVPAAFAMSDNAGGQENGQGSDTTPTVAAQQGDTTNTPQIAARGVKIANAKGKLKTVRERYQDAREKYKQNKEQLKERLAKAKERRKIVMQKHQQAKERIKERREQLTACKDSETESCKGLRKETKRNTKNYMSGVAEHMLSMIAKTKERVEASDMPDEQKREILTKLDAQAEEVASALDSMEELGEESSKEDFKEAAKVLRESWKETKKGIKKGVGTAAANKIRAAGVRMERLSAKVQKMLERLESSGQDVSAATEQLAKYDENLASAKAAREEAQAKYQSGDIEGAVEKTKEAHRYLLEAHKALKQIVRHIKQAKGGEDALKVREREQVRAQDGAGEQEQEQAGQEDAAEEEGDTASEGANETA